MPPWPMFGKRGFSALSWFFKRRHLHQKSVTDALVQEISAAAPDLVLASGDLINLSLPAEYRRAADWLHTLGTPKTVLAIPGNHDLLIDDPAARAGLALYSPFTGGNSDPDGAGFPVVKRHQDVLFIGLSTAIETPLGWCSGRLGDAQLARLDVILKDAEDEGLCRIIALHHPPAGYHKRRGGLEDHAAFARLIAARGAELIVHGHSHRAMMGTLPGPGGPMPTKVPVIGVASASVMPGKGCPAASWHEYAVRRERKGWALALNVHRYLGPGHPGPDGCWEISARALLRSP